MGRGGCVEGRDFRGVIGRAPLWYQPLSGGEEGTTSRQGVGEGVEANGKAALCKKW